MGKIILFTFFAACWHAGISRADALTYNDQEIIVEMENKLLQLLFPRLNEPETMKEQSANLPVVNEAKCACGRGTRSDMERIPRTPFMKSFLFWLQLRRYRCHRCQRNRWLLIK